LGRDFNAIELAFQRVGPMGQALLLSRPENRRARYYRLTKASKKQLSEQLKRYERISQAIARIVQPVYEAGV
jgi:hypothetical protein